MSVVGSFQPSHAMMLTFYALYKQATNGPCTHSQPYMWDVVGRAKWCGTFSFLCVSVCFLRMTVVMWMQLGMV